MDEIYDGKIRVAIDNLLRTKKFIHDDNLLQLFAFYIHSNANFNYNGTYLTDSILQFKEAHHLLKIRYVLFRSLAKNIAIRTPEKLDVILVFDNLIKFKISDSIIINTEYINLELYRFDKIDKDKFIVKFIIGDLENPKRTETYRLDFPMKMDKFEKVKLKRMVSNKWLEFIQ